MQTIQQGKKTRVISVPNEAMHTVHANFLAHLREQLAYWPGKDLFTFSTCGEVGDSPFYNVQQHLGNRYVYQTDIRAAYDSVDAELLARALLIVDRELGLPEGKFEAKSMMEQFEQTDSLLTFLRRYFLTEEGGLRTGAPASPLLFNLFAGAHLDRAVKEVVASHASPQQGALMRSNAIVASDPVYTRYMDDLTISSKRPIPESLREGVRQAIARANLTVSHHKTTLRDIRKGPVVITGIGVTNEGRIFVPREKVRKVRGLMHRVMAGLPTDENAIAQVHGHMSAATYLHRYSRAAQRLYGCTMPRRNATEEKLFRLYRRFRWFARKKNRQEV